MVERQAHRDGEQSCDLNFSYRAELARDETRAVAKMELPSLRIGFAL